MQAQAISLFELNRRIGATLNAAPELSNVWVVGETSDLRISGGHCYMELVEKDTESGAIRARARATIWASQYVRINTRFMQATGSPLSSGIKLMVRVSANFHPAFGLSLNITDVDPDFTLGDLLRRRREMLARLEAEGILNLNRELEWPSLVQRIAIISAAGAAGYGDFINQLYTNRQVLRFNSQLFPAVMQGEQAAPSIIAALERVAQADEEFDCVVIIRGGGTTGDLAAFENYDLAAHIAMFPIPVLIGIGHERDITLLDYVANTRVKTPTAAAELLIRHGVAALERVKRLGTDILERAAACINASHRRLENIGGQIPAIASGVISRQQQRLGTSFDEALTSAVQNIIQRRSERLKSFDTLLAALSPEATLRRGFSITRIDGKAVTSHEDLPKGVTITTTLASGEVKSIVTD